MWSQVYIVRFEYERLRTVPLLDTERDAMVVKRGLSSARARLQTTSEEKRHVQSRLRQNKTVRVRRPREVGTPFIRDQEDFMQSSGWQNLLVSKAFLRQCHLNKRAAPCCVKLLLMTVQ